MVRCEFCARPATGLHTATRLLGDPSIEASWERGLAAMCAGNRSDTVACSPRSRAVWDFHIGGYQVCEKWLKDRRGRTLSCEDIKHYQKIVVALSETIRIMAEIDAVIEHHGGWPLVGSVMERSE